MFYEKIRTILQTLICEWYVLLFNKSIVDYVYMFNG